MPKSPPCSKYEPPIHISYKVDDDEYCRVSANDSDLEKANCPKKYVDMDMDKLEYLLKSLKLPIFDTKYERCMTLKQHDLKKHSKDSFDCNNKEELYTLCEISDIDDEVFYPYYDPNDQKIYCFDHRVLAKIISDENNPKNPYNQYTIPEWIIADIQNNYISKKKKPLLTKINIKDKVNMKINDMFGEFDLLGYYTSELMKEFRQYDVYDLRLLYCLFYTDIKHNSDDLGKDMADNLKLQTFLPETKQLSHIYGLDKNGICLLFCNKVIHIIKSNLYEKRGFLVEYVNELLNYMIALNDIISSHEELMELYEDIFWCFSKIPNTNKYFDGKIFSKSITQFKKLHIKDKKKTLISLYINLEKNINSEYKSFLYILYRSIRLIMLD